MQARKPREPKDGHCFIVRVDERLDARLEAHRQALEKRRGRPTSLAQAARDLFYRALPPVAHLLKQRPAQLGLFGKKKDEENVPRTESPDCSDT